PLTPPPTPNRSNTQCPEFATAPAENAESKSESKSESKGESKGADGKGDSSDSKEVPPDEKKEEEDPEAEEPVHTSYEVKGGGVPESQFLKENPQGDAAAESKDDAPGLGSKPKVPETFPPVQWESDDETSTDDLAAAAAAADPLHGRRSHCWVLVRGGKRGETEMVFVEPTTARIYPVSEAPYLSIEACWNAKNYYVNMQAGKEMQAHSYDFANNDLWEFVFHDKGAAPMYEKPGAERSMAEMLADPIGEESKGAAGDFEDDDGEEKEGADEEENDNVLDVPESWVNKLTIKRSLYALRFPPDGQRVILYKKAKHELFAENVHDQGCVSKLTLYKDLARTIVKECRETFVNRQDKLAQRVRYPLERKVHESFAPGRAMLMAGQNAGVAALKELIVWTGKRLEMHFYVSARLDGLVCREETIGKKIIEKFEGRTDKLVYRSIAVNVSADSANKSTFILPGGGQNPDLQVTKMTEKYERNPAKDANEDIAKRTYNVKDHKVRTQYHYADSCITRSTAQHDKERAAELQEEGAGGDSLLEVLNCEKECLGAARASQSETFDILTQRRADEEEIVVVQPIFETAGEKRDEEKTMETEEEVEDEKDRRQVDYLTPFLQNITDLKGITRDDAQRVREACLKALKDRLLERVNIIQNRLNDENTKLAKQQAAFQRNQRDNDPDAEEEFERFCSEAMFRIQILEQRLVQHEENALRKYKDMDSKLLADPRMSVLRH
ncbi:hypothetical protein TeGR_g6973, partial [Tetraparma gracilis]